MTETEPQPDAIQPPRHPRQRLRPRPQIEGGGEWAPNLDEDNPEADLYLTKVNIETWLSAGLSKAEILELYEMDEETYERALKAQ